MKRYLLTAASALVLTAAASAQTVTLSGELSTVIDYDGFAFNGPNLGNGPDDGVLLTIEGSTAGWNYSAETDLFFGDLSSAVVTFENEALGSFEMSTNNVEWSKRFLDDTLRLVAYADPANVEALTVELETQVAGISVEAGIHNDADRTFFAEAKVPFMNTDFLLAIDGNLDDTSDVSYHIEVNANLLGLDNTISISETGEAFVETRLGAFTISTSVGDGDMFDEVYLDYTNEISDQMELQAQVRMDSGVTSGYASVILRF